MGMEYLSIVTLNNYDETIWDGLQVPTVDTYKDGLHTLNSVDKDLVISSIIMECADLQLIYPDLEYMKSMIGWWSAAEMPVWTKLYKTTILEYNPIWNVDADIVETDTGSGTNGGSNTESVKGYNSSSWADHTKDDSSGNWSDSRTRTTRRTGNIGVTATQELIQKERDIADFNIYKYITDSFKKRFCILVY